MHLYVLYNEIKNPNKDIKHKCQAFHGSLMIPYSKKFRE